MGVNALHSKSFASPLAPGRLKESLRTEPEDAVVRRLSEGNRRRRSGSKLGTRGLRRALVSDKETSVSLRVHFTSSLEAQNGQDLDDVGGRRSVMISGALAQANPPANPPAAKSVAAETKSPKFIQAQGTDKWVFSKFKGADVLGPDNAKVGSVSDLLFDKNGKIDGFIVGVGGFLGIGEKNVAIDMSA
jgi:hypothetical protein